MSVSTTINYEKQQIVAARNIMIAMENKTVTRENREKSKSKFVILYNHSIADVK
jgi:hypothetical protein